jgi:hypothetical protein
LKYCNSPFLRTFVYIIINNTLQYCNDGREQSQRKKI